VKFPLFTQSVDAQFQDTDGTRFIGHSNGIFDILRNHYFTEDDINTPFFQKMKNEKEQRKDDFYLNLLNDDTFFGYFLKAGKAVNIKKIPKEYINVYQPFEKVETIVKKSLGLTPKMFCNV
jgi:hypothetical protein